MDNLKLYLKMIDMSQGELAIKLGVSQQTISKWLNVDKKIPNKYNSKLIETLGLNSIEDINELLKNYTDDIKNIKIYLKWKCISQQKLAAKLGVGEILILKWLNGKLIMSYKYMLKILELLGLKSIYDLRELFKNYCNLEDVKNLNLYLKMIDMRYDALAAKLGVNIRILSKWLNGEEKMPCLYMTKSLEALDIKTSEDINELLNLSEITHSKEYMENLKLCLKRLGICNDDLAEKIGVSQNLVFDLLNCKRNMPFKYVLKILEFLKSKGVNDINEFLEKSSDTVDITDLKLYLKRVNVDYNKLSSKIGVTKDCFCCWLNGKRNMPYKYMQVLSKIFKIKYIKETNKIIVEGMNENLEDIDKNISNSEISKDTLLSENDKRLKNNLKVRFKKYEIEDDIFDLAVNYANEIFKKGGSLLIDLAIKYVYKYIIESAKSKLKYRNIIKCEYDKYKNIYIYENKISLDLLNKCEIEIIDNIINKYDDKLNFRRNIQKQIFLTLKVK